MNATVERVLNRWQNDDVGRHVDWGAVSVEPPCPVEELSVRLSQKAKEVLVGHIMVQSALETEKPIRLNNINV